MKNKFNYREFIFRLKTILIISVVILFLPSFGLSQPNRVDTVSSALDKLEGGDEETIVAVSDKTGMKGTLTQTVELPLLLEVQGRASSSLKNALKQDSGAADDDEIAAFLEEVQKTKEALGETIGAKAVENQDHKLPDIKVTLSFADVALGDVLNTLTKIADLNVVGGEGLSQKVTIYLKDVTLEEALDSILSSAGYTHLREGKILRIVPLKEGALMTKVFELKFASADQIVNALSGIMSERGIVKSFTKFPGAKNSNTLIVKDNPEVIKNIPALIQKLDTKPRQVMISTQLVEVTTSNINNLGIDWAMKASMYGAQGPTTFPLGREFQRIPERTYDQDNTLLVAKSEYYIVGNISFKDFTANMQFIDNKSKVEIVSNSKIAVRDSEEAEILIGDRVPIPIYERTGEAATFEITGYMEEHVGVILKVMPVINKDESVTLKVRPEISEITDWTGPNDERPIVATRQLNTSLTIANGKTIILGGLKKSTSTKTDKRAPFLSNIPIIGAAFKYKGDDSENKELLIFITPNILED